MGELLAAREHLEWAKAAIDSAESVPHQTAASLSLLAWDLAILGFFDQSMKVSQQTLVWVQGVSRPFAQAITLQFTSEFDQLRSDEQAAWEHSGSALDLGAEYGFPGPTSSARVIHGWARSCRGETESGIAEMRRGISDNKATGARTPTWLLVPLLETYMRIDRTLEAEHLLGEVIATVHQTDERMQEAELYRLKGELSLKARGNEQEAEACLRRAVEIARHQSAKWWELRATVSLGRLLAKQGRRDEARAMLAEIYNWFTEGFDTADLKDSKALLDELNT